MLLLRLHKLALRLRPALPWCFPVGIGGAALALSTLFRDDAASTQVLALALGVSVWALLLFAFIRLFQIIPPPVLPGDPFVDRLRDRIRLAFYHLLAVGTVLISLALVAMSLKLLSATAR